MLKRKRKNSTKDDIIYVDMMDQYSKNEMNHDSLINILQIEANKHARLDVNTKYYY